MEMSTILGTINEEVVTMFEWIVLIALSTVVTWKIKKFLKEH